jgi:hypothetical protein
MMELRRDACRAVQVRTRSGIVKARGGYHRPTSARRIRLDRGRSCRRRSRAERQPRGPRLRKLAAGRHVRWFAPELSLASRAQAAMLPLSISSSWFGSLIVWAKRQWIEVARSIVRSQPTTVRSGRQNCLREIAGFGSILRRFDRGFVGLRPSGTASGACRGRNRITGFLQNALILPAEEPGRSANDGQPDHEVSEISAARFSSGSIAVSSPKRDEQAE